MHFRARTVNFRLVRCLMLGSVPAAFVGSYLLHVLGHAKTAQHEVEVALGVALLVGSVAMVLRVVLDWRSGACRMATCRDVAVRPLMTIAVGAIGGLIVGITSVGSGSLMIVLLLFVYPTIRANQLVGTDLTQAVPLTLAAALGALVFGHIELGITTSLVIGSVPAVVLGSLVSSRVPDRYVRPAIALVIFASGLKYTGVGMAALGSVVAAAIVVSAVGWVSYARPWRRGRSQQRAPVAASTGTRLGHLLTRDLS